MPVLKHAKKKVRQDKKRTLRNRKVKDAYKALIKNARSEKTVEALNAAFSGLDKAAKNHIIHKNKASRLKSSLTKAMSKVEGQVSASPKKTKTSSAKKKTAKKTSAKKTKK